MTPAATPAPRLRALALLALVTALALWLRLSGVGFLLPKMVESDGRVLHEQVRLIEEKEGHPERDRNFVFYPLLIARTIVWASDPATYSTPAQDLREHLRRAAAPHKRIRTFVAILSALLVPATWLLARRLLAVRDGADARAGRDGADARAGGGALLAAAFMATSTLHLWFSQQGRPHAASAAFALFAVLAALNLRRKGRPLDYALAGIALGLAASSLQSGLIALLPFAAAILWRGETARRATSHVWAWALLSLAILAGCVALFYPAAFAKELRSDSATFAIEGNTLRLSGHIVFLDQLRGQGFKALFAALRDYDPWISALAAVGAALALAPMILASLGVILAPLGSLRARLGRPGKRLSPDTRRDLLVVLAFVIPYAIAAGIYGRTYQRFSMPLLPFVVCLAAYAAVRFGEWLPLNQRRVGRVAIGFLLLAPQVWLAWRLVEARRAPDTIDLAAEWIAEHVAPERDKILVLPTFEVPLPQTAAAIEASRPMSDNTNRPWYRYQDALPREQRPQPAFDLVTMPMLEDALRASIVRDPAAYLRDQHARWAVIEVFGEGRRPPVLGAVRRGLAEVADCAARFVPDAVDEGQELPLNYQDDELPQSCSWVWRTARAGRVGPVVEIWRFR